MESPWKKWVPGVLNRAQMKQLTEVGFITHDGRQVPERLLGKSSLDLTLSNMAYKMKRGSVKPTSSRPYSFFIQHEELGVQIDKPSDDVFPLERKHTYVFKLNESLDPGKAGVGIYGQATAKSSVGRVDVLARLIVDGMDSYESFTPKGLSLSQGQMYLEITPITFDVKVKVGTSLSQLRLFYGNPKDAEVKGGQLYSTIFNEGSNSDGSLAVNLDNVEIRGVKTAAFCHHHSAALSEAIPLWDENPNKPDPCKFWMFKEADSKKRLTIEPGSFYILRSKERISVPPGIAIYCRASDETIGEMRIHYAGFVHPWFGWNRKDKVPGTPLIFEVRGHQVPVTLADKEKMANLIFYRMSEDCEPPSEPKLGVEPSVKEEKADKGKYDTQNLDISGFFDKWPMELEKIGDDGTVAARKETGTVEKI